MAQDYHVADALRIVINMARENLAPEDMPGIRKWQQEAIDTVQDMTEKHYGEELRSIERLGLSALDGIPTLDPEEQEEEAHRREMEILQRARERRKAEAAKKRE
jgi:hypothetical protein